MTKIELITLVKNSALIYYNDNPRVSMLRNRHLTNYNGEPISNRDIKSLLVDFINNVAICQGVDYAMNVSEFDKELEAIQNKTVVLTPNTTKPDNIVDLNL